MWEFPESWEFGHDVSGWISEAVDWVVVNGDPLFDAINSLMLRLLLGPLEDLLLWLPWWLLVGVTGLLAWKIVG